MPAPSVRVVVRLPYNRPENALPDPPRIEWTAEKADILWKVIERSRSVESGAADWKGLAAHLEVPLPYLLYRVNARFQEEIRGLKDISGALSPTPTNHNTNKPEQGERSSVTGRTSARMGNSSVRLGVGANGLPSPIGVRARLNSLGSNSLRHKKPTSSSTITVQAPKRPSIPEPISPTSSEDEETDSEDEQARKEEEADRKAEEQDALDRKLQDLQQMMTNDTIGLVSSRERRQRGRRWPASPASPASLSTRRDDTLSSRSDSASQSVSSAESPHGSIPDIPSPPNGSQNYSPMGRHLSPSKSSSSPASLSPGLATGRRYAPLSLSEQESNHGSETSSFSDLSDSISASALESALMSNIRGNGSRLSQFTRSRLMMTKSRGGGVPL
ncbi:hypothetical protein M378DRAFT_156491 [Amanita muscaria Koide BX008]|uniref:Autophagy-related protein 29 n=1 Tax=Amanita muscaria (strain Koide BX008) TaxID=946122 RepID=A0A0C2T3B7_AMAMK|nr:hypothetical protein M378DRAFT_156491 [Amanita muscaria Koide BX008]